MNTQDPQMTFEFVKKVHNCGHRIIFIVDHIDGWESIKNDCKHVWETLMIKPKANPATTNCDVLLKAIGSQVNGDRTKELFVDGANAEQGNFPNTAEIIESWVKGKIENYEKIAKMLADGDILDSWVKAWGEN